MIDWVRLVLIMREVAIAFGLIMGFLVCGVILIRGRHEFSDKCYTPWEKEDKKRAKLKEARRK